MVVRKTKRSRKHRGSRTHGWGFGKRHRGKGNKPYRAGGGGKRGAHRKTIYLSLGISAIGKHGMQVLPRTPRVPQRVINLRNIEENLQAWVQQGLAEKKGDTFSIDLSKFGITKLLSEGQISKKLQVVCKSCSKSAKVKIEKAGGSLTIK